MGKLINRLRQSVEAFAGDRRWALQVGGVLITTIVVLASCLSGWLIERIAFNHFHIPNFLGSIVLVFAMASALASRSLIEGVIDVIKALSSQPYEKQLYSAREKLSHIVGRDVSSLNKEEILRATAETASENAVDGVFAPLFWMCVGAILWNFSTDLPGPLALGWTFKASSTIDSMIGYRYGRMRWMGTAGARLDDVLTWLPCRTVLLSLPLVSKPLAKMPSLINSAWTDGSKDISPNSGISEAIFAYCAEVKMGGTNRYNGKWVAKPNIAQNAPDANIESIKRILRIILKLEILWLITIAIFTIYFS